MTTPLAIKVSSRASAQIDEVAEWWAANRPSAPGAVRHDVAEILALLRVQPGAGAPARRSRVRGVRRAPLPRIRYYLYYRVSGSTLEVLAFPAHEQRFTTLWVLRQRRRTSPSSGRSTAPLRAAVARPLMGDVMRLIAHAYFDQ